MNEIFASQTVSVTELKRNFTNIIKQADGAAVAVLNNNKPEAYLVPAAEFQRLLERLEDLEDAMLVRQRQDGPFVDVNLNDL
jgi:prevent-host-death family protein